MAINLFSFHVGYRTLNFYFLGSLTANSDPDPASGDWRILVHYPGTLGSSEKWLINDGDGNGVEARYIGLYFVDVNAYVNFAEIVVGECTTTKGVVRLSSW